MDMSGWTALVVVCGSAVALMAPFEAQALRTTSMRSGRHLGWPRSLAFALCTTTAGIVAFVAVSAAIVVGVPALLGDMTGLPWLTALPGILAGFWAGRAINRRLIAMLLGPPDRPG